MVARFASLFAHQGGWDEILWVLAPIAVMVWLLSVATRRISRNKNDVSAESSESPD